MAQRPVKRPKFEIPAALSSHGPARIIAMCVIKRVGLVKPLQPST